MTRCIMVYERKGSYYRIPDTEVEDWEEVLDAIDGTPTMIETVNGFPPYKRAYRMPDGSVYLVALDE